MCRRKEKLPCGISVVQAADLLQYGCYSSEVREKQLQALRLCVHRRGITLLHISMIQFYKQTAEIKACIQLHLLCYYIAP